MEVTGPPSRIPLKWKLNKSLYMYNYFSIGVDAQVTLNFHKARESPFYMFSSRIINKVRLFGFLLIIWNVLYINIVFRHCTYVLELIKWFSPTVLASKNKLNYTWTMYLWNYQNYNQLCVWTLILGVLACDCGVNVLSYYIIKYPKIYLYFSIRNGFRIEAKPRHA